MTGKQERGAVSAGAIAAALSTRDAEERRQATSRIVELDRKEALPLLLSALGDDDWRVRKEATIAARAFLPDPVLIEALIKVLGAAYDVGQRNAAVEVLASAGRAAVKAITEAMASLDNDGRKLAVDALGRSRDPSALGPLEVLLFDQDDNVRQAAVEAIAVIGAVAGEAAHKILIHCLSEDDRFMRLAALEGLNQLGAIISWSRIEPLLDDPTSRAAALSAAALAGHPNAPMALAKALVSSRGGAFAQAVVALARLAEGPLATGVAEAVRAQGAELGARLVRIAEGKDADLEHLRPSALALAAVANADGAIAAAIQALGEPSFAVAAPRALAVLGPSALPALIELIAPAERRAAAERGLASIAQHAAQSSGASGAPASFRPSLIPVAEPPSVPAETEIAAMRAAAIDVTTAIALESAGVAELPPGALLAALRSAALDADKDVAASALYAIARLGTDADLTLAAERALSPVLPIASAAEAALSSLTGRFSKTARALANGLMKSEHLSLASAIILGALGSAGDLDPADIQAELAFLASSATGGDARTRRAAVMAVGEIGGVWATDVLSFALADEEREVQLAAARALGRVCADPAAGRFLEAAPPSAGPLSLSMPAPRASATDVLDLIGRSGDNDLVAAAVNALGDGMTTWAPPSLPPSSRGGSDDGGEAAGFSSPAPFGRPFQPSMLPGDDLIAALTPLASKAPSAVAIAAVDALSRAPSGTIGRQSALLGALQHPDPAVIKASMLKLDRTDAAADKIARCLDHASRDVRLLAAELLTGTPRRALQEKLRRRLAVETDPAAREAIERALVSDARRHGGASGP